MHNHPIQFDLDVKNYTLGGNTFDTSPNLFIISVVYGYNVHGSNYISANTLNIIGNNGKIVGTNNNMHINQIIVSNSAIYQLNNNKLNITNVNIGASNVFFEIGALYSPQYINNTDVKVLNQMSKNEVTISGGDIYAKNMYALYAPAPERNFQLNENKVYIKDNANIYFDNDFYGFFAAAYVNTPSASYFIDGKMNAIIIENSKILLAPSTIAGLYFYNSTNPNNNYINNYVLIKNSTIKQTSNYGTDIIGAFATNGNISENRVEISNNSDIFVNKIIGASSTNGDVKNNKVIIDDSTINYFNGYDIQISGGISYSFTSGYNQVNITNTTFLDNSTNNAFLNIYGFYGISSYNKVNIKNSTILSSNTNIYGAYIYNYNISTFNTLLENEVNIADSTNINADFISGIGFNSIDNNLNISNNKVITKNSTLTINTGIYGVFVDSSKTTINVNTNGNSIDIIGSNITTEKISASYFYHRNYYYVDTNNTHKNNITTINASTISSEYIFGAFAQNGNASGNKVDIKNNSTLYVSEIIGAYIPLQQLDDIISDNSVYIQKSKIHALDSDNYINIYGSNGNNNYVFIDTVEFFDNVNIYASGYGNKDNIVDIRFLKIDTADKYANIYAINTNTIDFSTVEKNIINIDHGKFNSKFISAINVQYLDDKNMFKLSNNETNIKNDANITFYPSDLTGYYGIFASKIDTSSLEISINADNNKVYINNSTITDAQFISTLYFSKDLKDLKTDTKYTNNLLDIKDSNITSIYRSGGIVVATEISAIRASNYNNVSFNISNNKVNIDNSDIIVSRIYSIYFDDFNNGDINNPANIPSGDVANITSNILTINKSNINSIVGLIQIYGVYTELANASKNEINISNSTFNEFTIIRGTNTHYGALTNNIVRIKNTTFNKIAEIVTASYYVTDPSYNTDIFYNNNIFIKDVTFNYGNQYDHNVISLTTPNGIMTIDGLHGTGSKYTGINGNGRSQSSYQEKSSTLILKSKIDIHTFNGFKNLEFYLPTNFKDDDKPLIFVNSGILAIDGKIFLDNANFKLDVGVLNYNENDKIPLIFNDSCKIIGNDCKIVIDGATIVGTNGWDFELLLEDSDKLYAVIKGVGLSLPTCQNPARWNEAECCPLEPMVGHTCPIAPDPDPILPPQILQNYKALSESFIASFGLLLQGADEIADTSYLKSLKPDANGIIAFGNSKVGESKYETGSYINLNGVNVYAGLGYSMKNLVVGIFTEYGQGNYKSHNETNTGATINGNGGLSYIGGGLLARVDHNEWVYYDATFHAGNLTNSFNSKDIDADFDAKALYYGYSAGLGVKFRPDKINQFELFIKYLGNTRQNIKKTISSDDPVEFDTLKSNRERLGGKYIHSFKNNFYGSLGADYTYEFDGEQQARIRNNKIEQPTLKGGTASAKIGFGYNTDNFIIDFYGSGYVGVRNGYDGGVKFRYMFDKAPPPPPAKPVPVLSETFSGKGATFKTNSFQLSNSAKARAFELTKKIMQLRNQDYTVYITGHTDNQGKKAKNKKLSLQRAQSYKKELVENGIDAWKIIVAGMGDEEPKTTNKTAKGREENRRIEIDVIDNL
ncbi:MAG: hypothetical protein Ta2D_01050 [Rickettsiales bacterium]|nr:MAG: hypothetical protein Ta2D_01050 [Rickettsiales bacterium]